MQSWNMVGTPPHTPIRSSAMVASISAGSNRSWKTMAPPATIFRQQMSLTDPTWLTGRLQMIFSSLPPRAVDPVTPHQQTPRWVSSAPLGRPVLPEV